MRESSATIDVRVVGGPHVIVHRVSWGAVEPFAPARLLQFQPRQMALPGVIGEFGPVGCVVVAGGQDEAVGPAHAVPGRRSPFGFDRFADADGAAGSIGHVGEPHAGVFEEHAGDGNAAGIAGRERIRGAGTQRIIVDRTIDDDAVHDRRLQDAVGIAGAEKERYRLAQGQPVRSGVVGIGVEIHPRIQRGRVEVGEQVRISRKATSLPIHHSSHAARGKPAVRFVVVVQRQANLLEVIPALKSPGGFPGRLHRGEQERDQDTDDGDHHQQFDQGERTVRQWGTPVVNFGDGTVRDRFGVHATSWGIPFNGTHLVRKGCRTTIFHKLSSFHQCQKLSKQILAVVRTGGGFGMILHAEGRQFAVPDAFDRLIVQIDVRDFRVARAATPHPSEAVVLRGDLHLAGAAIQHRLVGAAMAELQLVDFPPQRQAQQLLAQTDAEDGLLAQRPRMVLTA